MEIEEEANNPLHNILTNLIFEDNMLKKIWGTDIIINALDKDMKKDLIIEVSIKNEKIIEVSIKNENNEIEKIKMNVIQFQKYLHTLLDDINFMRKLEHNTHMKSNVETSIELFGQDFISEPEFNYNIEFEKKLIEIQKNLAKFLGSLLKELSKGEDINL